MSYDDHLANRVREQLISVRKVKEKRMMGGLTFMVNDKMCVGILNDDLMVRIDPDIYDESTGKKGMQGNGFYPKTYERICVCRP